MVAQPASVSAARRFVAEALAGWGRHELMDDIGLCVSELTTNVSLHSGSPYFQLEVEEQAGAVRLAVADSGLGSADVLSRQPQMSDAFLDDLSADDASATGRGMFLVSALASAWGIDELPIGKRVWAEFHPEGMDGHDGVHATPVLTQRTDDPLPALDPEAWPVVRFRGSPAALLIAHDENLAEYIRELQLIGDRLDEPAFQRLGELMGGYVAQHATNWDAARVLAHEAVRDGRELIDIDVLATRDIRASLAHLRSLIGEAESLSREGRLMTLPAGEPVQRARDWMEGEFLAQIEDSAEPLPYPDWLAGARR